MRFKFLSFALLTVLKANAQGGHFTDTVVKGVRYHYVEQMPVAGYDVNKYIADNLHYPDSARVHNIAGKVVVKFVVDEDGSITDCQVIKSVSKECDAEAIRVVQNMPRWKPGRDKGKPVKVDFAVPVIFKLQ